MKTMIRSESTALLSPAGRQAAVDYGIRTIIDLRFPYELEMAPSPFAAPRADLGAEWPDYLNIPLDTDQDLIWPGNNLQSPAEAMSDLYVRLLEANRVHVAAVLTTMSRARPGGILFHCYAGKDRTGLIAALLLSIAGVGEEAIADDYAVHTPPIEQRRLALLTDPALTPERRAYLDVVTRLLPDTMRLTLDYLRRRYGSVDGYLRTTTFSVEDQTRLCARLLE
jgi:protein-tyrosine phosphatase